MTGRASTFGLAALAAMVGNWLDRLVRRMWKPLAVVALAPLFWLWTQAVMVTGSVRGGTLLLAVGLAVLVALAVWGRTLATTAWIRHHRRDQPAAVAGGPDPECLYRWYEPDDVPYGARCACGKPRYPGELAYVGITNNLERRASDSDRLRACWWHAGLDGKVKLYGSRKAVEVAERRAIAAENPRENIAHAGRR